MIDVIIPTKNSAESLWMTLTYFWDYGYDPSLIASVILLDNCSSTPRHKQVMDTCQKMERHQVIRHENDVGVWCSINRGLAMTTQRYVLVLTSDVLLGPDVIKNMLEFAQKKDYVNVGPDTLIGIKELERLRNDKRELSVDFRYNGSVWLLDWGRLKEEVGWYDPQFYISFGDVDYIERLHGKATATGDNTYSPVVLRNLWTVHMDKQTRRTEMNSERDTEMELRDGSRFREKWKDRPDVIAMHPELSKEGYVQWKEHDLGGWEQARVK